MYDENSPIGHMRMSINELRGIRYIETPGDGSDGAIDAPTAPEPVENVNEPEPYAPTGEEPWAPYMENVPDVLKPEIDRGFREMSAAADQRIASLTPYEPLVAAGVNPQEAQIAVEFASMLYGQVDPNDPVAMQLSKQQRLNFHTQYTAILEQQGVLTPAQKQQADADEAARLAQEREFETEADKKIRELSEQQAQLLAQQQELINNQQSQQQQTQYTALQESYKADWTAAITKHGQVSKKEFGLISMLANQDPDDSPGVITRAYETMIATYGRMPDPETVTPAGKATPKPPVLQTGGNQQIVAPTTPSMRLDDPRGRHNRRDAALEAIALLEQEGAPQV